MKETELGRKNISKEAMKARYCKVYEVLDGVESLRTCEIKDIKKGDVFRVFESDDTIIHENGYIWLIAYKDSVYNDKEDRYRFYTYVIYDSISRLNFFQRLINQ
jgi:hypothetical protein